MTNAEALPGQAAKVKLRFSHAGFFVHDLPKMIEFYTGALGFTLTERGIYRGSEIVFLSWDPNEHHQIVLVSGRSSPLEFNHLNQLSFRVASVEELQTVWRSVKDQPELRDGRAIDHGNAWSYYFRDPEGNRIEIFCDTDWHVSQPCDEPLDLSLPPAEIRRRSETFCRQAPGFQPIGAFRNAMAVKIDGITDPKQ
jgi:catechol-2,3-dioxygenase